MTTKDLGQEFSARYGKQATDYYYCPGRVNLIGEHIDYNGGKVMPCAIGRGTWLALAPNEEKVFRFQCLNFPETATLELKDAYISSGEAWFNYPLGMINEFLKRGHLLSGLDLLFYGDIPIGAGLSSSASIEVLMGETINQLFDLKIAAVDIALLAKAAENNFVGVNCGIMDQFAVAMGKKDKAILLDCNTLYYEYIPFELGDYSLMVINTNKPRRLAESKYNERFAECRTALKLLQVQIPVKNLCDISVAQFEMNQQLIDDVVILKRARHVITENARVADATIAMQTGDLEVLGKLMYASHKSLKEDYEVSCPELDTIVTFSKEFAGCIGARMTGAGFGGCAIALVNKARASRYIEELNVFYKERTGYAPEAFMSTAEDGARRL
jgi:galactokinase